MQNVLPVLHAACDLERTFTISENIGNSADSSRQESRCNREDGRLLLIDERERSKQWFPRDWNLQKRVAQKEL